MQIDNFFSFYLSSIYFIITAFASIGYGDIYAVTINEMLFTIVLMMTCQFMFSFFTGRIKYASFKKDYIKVKNVQNELLESTELFFVHFTKIKGARRFSRPEVKSILEYVDASFRFNFVKT